MLKAQDDWFEEWFNTPYYHWLYHHRDDKEAQAFVDALVSELEPSESWHFLDLACGNGRHARYLHQKGYRVSGMDLSPRNIESAEAQAQDGLDFWVGDMRQAFGENRYDCILNLFTSFGYFEEESDSLSACANIKRALKPGGILILDFLNVAYLKSGLTLSEEKEVRGIRFQIERRLEDEKVVKHITFEHQGKAHHFVERVQLLDLDDFKRFFAKNDLQLLNTFGSYALEPFDAETSERLILKVQA